jgi:hypothetical protein
VVNNCWLVSVCPTATSAEDIAIVRQDGRLFEFELSDDTQSTQMVETTNEFLWDYRDLKTHKLWDERWIAFGLWANQNPVIAADVIQKAENFRLDKRRRPLRSWEDVPAWSKRNFPRRLLRSAVVEKYQQGIGLECSSCNRRRAPMRNILQHYETYLGEVSGGWVMATPDGSAKAQVVEFDYKALTCKVFATLGLSDQHLSSKDRHIRQEMIMMCRNPDRYPIPGLLEQVCAEILTKGTAPGRGSIAGRC